jgi:hypothetical protein
MEQHWQDPASPASTAPAPPARLQHGNPDTREAWAATPWAVVTATGIVQARCGQPTSPGACGAWRLSAPAGSAGSPAMRAAASRPRLWSRPPAPAPPAWRGVYVAGDRRRYRVEACAGHRRSLTHDCRVVGRGPPRVGADGVLGVSSYHSSLIADDVQRGLVGGRPGCLPLAWARWWSIWDR